MYEGIVIVGGKCPTCSGNKYRPVRSLHFGLKGEGVCLSCGRTHTFLSEFFSILFAAENPVEARRAAIKAGNGMIAA